MHKAIIAFLCIQITSPRRQRVKGNLHMYTYIHTYIHIIYHMYISTNVDILHSRTKFALFLIRIELQNSFTLALPWTVSQSTSQG